VVMLQGSDCSGSIKPTGQTLGALFSLELMQSQLDSASFYSNLP
jgi:hypothetical protein